MCYETPHDDKPPCQNSTGASPVIDTLHRTTMEEWMPEIESLSTELGFEQVTIKFTPADVAGLASRDRAHAARIKFESLIAAVQAAFAAGSSR